MTFSDNILLCIQLVPGYRGYTIDSIRQLTILDDIRISADEKHFFKGLSKLKGMFKDLLLKNIMLHALIPLSQLQLTVYCVAPSI